MAEVQPTGTVTFLFTDIEGSTRLWREHPDAMPDALARHDELVRGAVEDHQGYVVKTTGDGFHAAFADVRDALDAAIDTQRALGREPWPLPEALRARAGIHTGPAQLRDGDYYGTTVNRAARLMSAAHGGQILVSDVSASLLDGDAELLDLGAHRLRDMPRAETIHQALHPDLLRTFPTLATLDDEPGELPAEPNRFVGRSALIESVARELQEAPVVTLTGPGGVGKTRLAVRVAATVRSEFADGAWFVDLAPISAPDRVPAATLETLGYTLAPEEDGVGGLCARLRRRRLLLVLDNCEHVVGTVATMVDAITNAAPGVRVLATSREGLGIAPERVLPIAPLGTDAGGEATELFVARARALRPDFAVDDRSIETVEELCRRLDGIPLAVELAAARTTSMSPASILERLDERFRMLTGGTRTAVARHQTLQAAVDWSYDALEEPERAVLDRLSVFAGSFTIDAATAVATDERVDEFDVLEHVSTLVDKSLVIAEPAQETFRLLETIRQYAAAKLGESGEAQRVRLRHAEHYRGLAAEIAPLLAGPRDIEAFRLLSTEFENIRQMLDCYEDLRRGDVVVDVIYDMNIFVHWYGYAVEMIGRLERAVPVTLDDDRLARLHGVLAQFKSIVGHSVAHDAGLAAEHARAADVPVPIESMIALANQVMTFDGDSTRAIAMIDDAVTAAREIDEEHKACWAEATCAMYRALAAPGDDVTLHYVDEVGRHIDRLGSTVIRLHWSVAQAIAITPADADRALRAYEEQIEESERLDIREFLATALFFHGLLLADRRRAGDAARSWRRALALYRDMGNRRGMTNVIPATAGLALRTGHSDVSLLLLVGARAAREHYGFSGSSMEQQAERRIEQLLRQALGDVAVDDAVAPRSPESTIDLALDALTALAQA